MLALLSTAELLGMSVWLAASAVAPEFQARWGLSAAETALLTSAVQVGFVVGTLIAAVLNLADIAPSRTYFAAAAVLAAGANAALIVAPEPSSAIATRFCTGFFLAGVYPPAMKMAATWFRTQRGLAIGTVVGALTVGKATPYLIGGLGGASPEPILGATSAAAGLAALLVLAGYRDGPYAFERRRFSWSLVGDVFGVRRWRLVTSGYLGHMWELYSFWTWIGVWLAASARQAAGDGAPSSTALVAFVAIAIGGAGCVWGGWVADRIGRERLVTRAMALSGTAAVSIGLVFGSPLWLAALVASVWGFFVIADSAQFSALVTESVPLHAVGTALTLQTSLGFLLTTVTIQLVPYLAESSGWRWAFAVLAVGPAVGIAAIRRIDR